MNGKVGFSEERTPETVSCGLCFGGEPAGVRGCVMGGGASLSVPWLWAKDKAERAPCPLCLDTPASAQGAELSES